MSEITSKTLATIEAAIAHARAKHGDRTIDHLPLHHRVSVLVEEVGEVASEVQRLDDARGTVAEAHVASCLRAELAQVVACATMWLLDLEADRG